MTIKLLIFQFGITRRKLAATGSQVEYERSKNAQAMADYEGKLKRIEELKNINESLRTRFKEVTNRSTSAAEQTKQLEEMLMVGKCVEVTSQINKN